MPSRQPARRRCYEDAERSVTKKDGAKNWVGQALPRKEENRLLRGRGKFADDIKLREMLYLRFVRSPFAHAKIVSVDISAAETLAGVVCTLTGAEIAAQTQPFIEIGPDPCAQDQRLSAGRFQSALPGRAGRGRSGRITQPRR